MTVRGARCLIEVMTLRSTIMPTRPISQLISKQALFVATPRSTVSEACALMKAGNVGAIPVVEEGRLCGIFTERDAVYRVLAQELEPHSTRLEQVMTAAPQTITPDRPFGHALHLMYEGGFRHVPVVEGGRLVGMVSARDALGTDLAQFKADVEEREHIAEILG
jgi:CBS domain-containing protein